MHRKRITLALLLVAACGDAQDNKPKLAPAPSATPPVEARTGAAARGELLGRADVEINPRLLRRFQQLPKGGFPQAAGGNESEKIALGKELFYDPRLSLASDVSCNSCHDLEHFGTDGARSSTGHKHQIGGRNAPTVYNAAGYFAQFWDGRAPSIEEQAKGPILNPVEMAMPDGAAVVVRLKAIAGYRDHFKRAFPDASDPLTYDNVGAAIGAFERKLTTPGRWDRFLGGDGAALTAEEKNGLKTFLNAGCMVCHTGPLLGGTMFERVGVVEAWPNQEDVGRMKVTKAPEDRMMFKVPTLRNIAETGPYFHDGSATKLEDAVRMMGKHQLGLELSEDEAVSIATWLRSLTGEIPSEVIAKPVLP